MCLLKTGYWLAVLLGESLDQLHFILDEVCLQQVPLLPRIRLLLRRSLRAGVHACRDPLLFGVKVLFDLLANIHL